MLREDIFKCKDLGDASNLFDVKLLNRYYNKFAYELTGDNLNFFFEDGNQKKYQMELKHAQAGLFMFLTEQGDCLAK